MNRLQRLFPIDVPLVQGPMGGVAGPELVAAVANAGALGVLPIWPESGKEAARLIEETRDRTEAAFAVNLRADLVQLDLVRVAFDLGVRHFHLFWGDPAETASLVHELGASFFATVGDGAAARAAIEAGAVALVAQGIEAGGHVLSETPLERLLPAVIEAAGDVPVIAAGGIATPEDARAALGEGAAGVLCGSRFVATHESDAHPAYKAALVRAGADATTRSLCFDLGWSDAPHRTLVNETYRIWREAGLPAMGARPGEGEVVMCGEDGTGLPRYFVMPPLKGMTGDVTEGAMYAGTGVERLDSIEAVADVVARFRAALLPGPSAGSPGPRTSAARA